jgi:hypothetical protein
MQRRAFLTTSFGISALAMIGDRLGWGFCADTERLTARASSGLYWRDIFLAASRWHAAGTHLCERCRLYAHSPDPGHRTDRRYSHHRCHRQRSCRC